jgi:hypothetical protein
MNAIKEHLKTINRKSIEVYFNHNCMNDPVELIYSEKGETTKSFNGVYFGTTTYKDIEVSYCPFWVYIEVIGLSIPERREFDCIEYINFPTCYSVSLEGK